MFSWLVFKSDLQVFSLDISRMTDYPSWAVASEKEALGRIMFIYWRCYGASRGSNGIPKGYDDVDSYYCVIYFRLCY